MAILELKDVTKKFGGLTAVDGVCLKVEENQICAPFSREMRMGGLSEARGCLRT